MIHIIKDTNEHFKEQVEKEPKTTIDMELYVRDITYLLDIIEKNLWRL